MKKFALLLILLLAFQIPAFADLASADVQTGLVILDLPGLSAVDRNENNEITSFTGVNLGLGISHRSFFEPVKANQWNNSWDIGTVALLIPYVGIGTDHVWENGWYFGVGTIYIIPIIRGGLYF
ncbi:hypothetical protein ACFLZ2_01995 [Candidatus Margulisiibacteriota bacterium]